MTPKEIANHLLTQTTLTEETMGPLLAYCCAKRATGAPVDLENVIIRAARSCEEARVTLHEYLTRAAKEATLRAKSLAEHGVLLDDYTYFYLDGRQSAEDMGRRLVSLRERMREAIAVWLVYADRIVATDEDRARLAAERREAAIARWRHAKLRDIKAAIARRGVALPRDASHAEMIAALVDAGVTP